MDYFSLRDFRLKKGSSTAISKIKYATLMMALVSYEEVLRYLGLAVSQIRGR